MSNEHRKLESNAAAGQKWSFSRANNEDKPGDGMMTDSEFLAQFEACTLPIAAFPHQGHLRLTWIYLSNHDLQQSMQYITEGILRYATSLGAAHKYHDTLTRAWVLLVYQAMQKHKTETFNKFLSQNQHLLNKDALSFHYSKELLASNQARHHWVEPDLMPFGN